MERGLAALLATLTAIHNDNKQEAGPLLESEAFYSALESTLGLGAPIDAKTALYFVFSGAFGGLRGSRLNAWPLPSGH